MLEVSVLSHRYKGEDQGAKTPTLFLSLIVEVKDNDGTSLLQMVVSDCRLERGVLKPPARPGGWQRVFFPQVYFINGLRSNPMVGAMYKIVEELCIKYNMQLAPLEECFAFWLPDKKIFKNFQNMTLGENDIVWKN